MESLVPPPVLPEVGDISFIAGESDTAAVPIARAIAQNDATHATQGAARRMLVRAASGRDLARPVSWLPYKAFLNSPWTSVSFINIAHRSYERPCVATFPV